MNDDFGKDYLAYRIKRSHESLEDAKILASKERWNACVTRLYYACFHIINALFYEHKINAQTHSGVKSQFGLNYIKTGKIDVEYGKMYSDLMDWRQKVDYGFIVDFNKETVQPMIEKVESFLQSIEKNINSPK